MAKVSSSRQEVGRWGENLAAEFLIGLGCSIVDRNVRTPYGEIDLIVKREEMVLFVEVKTRRSSAYGHPEEAITGKKKTHLIQAAEAYLQMHPELGNTWQIDVIAIQSMPDQSQTEIVYFENAIT